MATAPGSLPSDTAITNDTSAQPAGQKSKTWLSLFSVLSKSPSSTKSLSDQQPQTIAEVEDIVAANTPVFFFHNQEQCVLCSLMKDLLYCICIFNSILSGHQETLSRSNCLSLRPMLLHTCRPPRSVVLRRYFPCTVDWFLERCRLVRVATGWKRRVLEVMVDFGMLDSKTLAREQESFSSRKRKKPRQFLQLELEPSARQGQPGDVNKVGSSCLFICFRSNHLICRANVYASCLVMS